MYRKLVASATILEVLLVLIVGLDWPIAASAGKSPARYTAQAATARYSLDSSQSKFIAHAYAGGLFWFKGHDHYVAASEFGSLHLVVKSGSLVETGTVFTEQQKQIINKELREIVLQPDQYPEIIFQSTNVRGKSLGSGRYDLKISGNLTLHGVIRPIEIPAQVTLTGNDMRAVGEFSIDRGDYKVKATSAFHGLVRIRGKLKFNFDIVGHRR